MSVSSGLEDISVIEFASIDDLDPSLADGYKCVFDREVPIEIRTINDTLQTDEINVPILEAIKVKVLTQGTDDVFTTMRIEFSSEADLFFQYSQTINNDTFTKIREEQRLMVDFTEFPNVLIKMLNSCIREPKTFLVILALFADGKAKMELIQNMDFKYVELMSLPCKQSEDEMVQRQITFRYNSMKQRLALMQSRLHELNQMVKQKNPSLLLQLQQKSSSGAAAVASQKASVESSTSKRSFYP